MSSESIFGIGLELSRKRLTLRVSSNKIKQRSNGTTVLLTKKVQPTETALLRRTAESSTGQRLTPASMLYFEEYKMYIVVCLLIVVIIGLTWYSINLAIHYRDLESSYLREHDLRNMFAKAICKHRREVRIDPCWQHDCDLWAALGDNDTEWPHGRYSSKKEMRDGCRAYIDECFDKC